MILSKEVEMIWNVKTKKYYENLGYFFTKYGEVFNIKIKDLLPKSRIKILVACDICMKEKIISINNYNKNFLNCSYYSCSWKCSHEKYKKTSLKNYGVENPSQNIIIKNIIKESCFKNHGVESPLQCEIFKAKHKKTCLERYGVENPSQNQEIKNKKIEKSLIKYGVENPSQNEDVKKKMIETFLERYGEAFLHFIPRYNINSIFYLDMISDILNIPIQHALNGGEKKFQKYWVDGYNEQYNICLEWDEKYHFNVKQKEKDIEREKFLIEKHDCKIIRINEKEFLEDVEIGIEKIIIDFNTLIDKN